MVLIFTNIDLSQPPKKNDAFSTLRKFRKQKNVHHWFTTSFTETSQVLNHHDENNIIAIASILDDKQSESIVVVIDSTIFPNNKVNLKNIADKLFSLVPQTIRRSTKRLYFVVEPYVALNLDSALDQFNNDTASFIFTDSNKKPQKLTAFERFKALLKQLPINRPEIEKFKRPGYDFKNANIMIIGNYDIVNTLEFLEDKLQKIENMPNFPNKEIYIARIKHNIDDFSAKIDKNPTMSIEQIEHELNHYKNIDERFFNRTTTYNTFSICRFFKESRKNNTEQYMELMWDVSKVDPMSNAQDFKNNNKNEDNNYIELAQELDEYIINKEKEINTISFYSCFTSINLIFASLFSHRNGVKDKIEAAKELKSILQGDASNLLSKKSDKILTRGTLGEIVRSYGGLHEIINNIPDKTITRRTLSIDRT